MERPPIEDIRNRSKNCEGIVAYFNDVANLCDYALLLEKALELACLYIEDIDCPAGTNDENFVCPNNNCPESHADCWQKYWLAQAKEATDGKAP